MPTVFMDTSYLIALELRSDQNHHQAQMHWQQGTPTRPTLVTSSYVFDEVVTFFQSRGHHAKAIHLGTVLLQSPTITLIHIDIPLFEEGWHYFQAHQDKTYSLTDCLSFVIMDRQQITTAFTFDHHFTQAGYHQEP